MELTVANVLSNLLVLWFKSLCSDFEDIFSSLYFFLHDFPDFFLTRWNSLRMKKQICNSCEPHQKVYARDKKNHSNEKGLRIAEINLMMNGLGMEGDLDGNENNSSLVAEDLLALFDHDEPSFEEIKETFGVFDANKDGFIDAKELQRVLCNLGLKEGCSFEECQRMITSCVGNGDCLTGFQEFVKLTERCLC